MSVVGRLCNKIAAFSRPCRVTALVDSFVVAAAVSKGRTSSRGLAPSLRRLNAVCTAAGIHLHTAFVPTRLNVADDPTRNADLRCPSSSLDVTQWNPRDIYLLNRLPRLNRWSSNWVRLVLSLLGPRVLDLSDRSVFRHALPWHFPLGDPPPSFDFDATLGFPGEGPFVGSVFVSFAFCLLKWFMLGPRYLWFFLGALAMVQTASAMQPRNAADLTRQAQRQVRPPLASGRPVLPVTSINREALFRSFSQWCSSERIDLDQLLEYSLSHVEELNSILVRYGRGLYSAGRPYGHYSETINALVSQRPILRRQLQMAWDYAFSWVKSEPPMHHMACPWQILLAMLSTCLLWGWTKEAGLLALMWGGLLRPGEAVKALRKDLLLPSDTSFTNRFALLDIHEAKTRFTVAHHQCAKVDSEDLLRVIALAFQNLSGNERLWPFSAQTLRLRFRSLLSALDLEKSPDPGLRVLDLGSLRPGGATWLLQVTEQAELVRRRGRWISARVLEVYLQEVGSARLMNALQADQRSRIYGLCDIFLATLEKAEWFQKCGINPSTWYRVFSWS